MAGSGLGPERPGEVRAGVLQALVGLLVDELVERALGVGEPLARAGVLSLPLLEDRLVLFGVLA